MKVLYSKKNGISNKLSGVNLPVDADKINYDNTESELQSTNVQDAIDEVNSGKVDKVAGKGLSANDYTNEDKAKVGKIDETTTSATGNPISITGLKSNQLAINPIITLEPIQAGSGDPSPSNVRAISGYDKIEVLSCGKNLVESIETGYYDYDTGATGSSNNYCRTSKFNIVGGKKYSLQVGVWGSPINTIFYWKDDAYLGYDDILITPDVFTYTFTTREDANMCAICCGGSNYPITPERWSDVMVEYGEIPTSFEPYNPITNIQLQLGQTIYGGTLDVEKGILTVDKVKRTILEIINSTPTHVVIVTTNRQGNCWIYTNDPIPDARATATTSGVSDSICDHYKIDSSDNTYNTDATDVFAIDTHSRFIVTSSTSYANSQEFISACGTYEVVYPLATPYTIQLTPHEISLLKDYAYVSTNGTSMSFSYKNGELASLGDVAQLGETVNLLGDVKYYSNNHCTIYQMFNNFLFIYLHKCSISKLPIKISSRITWGIAGITQFYDTISQDNCHINLEVDGNFVVNSSQDVTLQTYNIYGVFMIPGIIAD